MPGTGTETEMKQIALTKKTTAPPPSTNVNGNGNGNGNSNSHATTNGFTAPRTNGRSVSRDSSNVEGEEEEGDDSTIADPNEQLKMENLTTRGAASARMSVGSANGGIQILNGADDSEDVEMS